MLAALLRCGRVDTQLRKAATQLEMGSDRVRSGAQIFQGGSHCFSDP